MSSSDRSVRAGIIGVGRLGREHARIYASLGNVRSLACYDRDESRAAEIAERYGAENCSTVEKLLEKCDVASICTPATNHHEVALLAFDRGVHVLVEKPLAESFAVGRDLVERSEETGCILQVGHIERFNGAFQAAYSLLKNPLFIESHRLATFSPRGTDVSVVVDLMIHDIDLILTVLGNDKVVDLRASGTGVLTGSPDIVNARLEFACGCVANITASRISREPLRKIRFFQDKLYISVDLKEKSVEAYGMSADGGSGILDADPSAFIRRIPLEVDRAEPLRKEIVSFIEAVQGKREPVVTGMQALGALKVAEDVLDGIKSRRSG